MKTWTAVRKGSLLAGSLGSAAVYDASFDGSVAVGRNVVTNNHCFQCPRAVRWDGAEVTASTP